MPRTKPGLSPSDLARGLAAQRKQVSHHCLVCGTAFTGLAQARYCSHRCTVAAWRERERSKAIWGAAGLGE